MSINFSDSENQLNAKKFFGKDQLNTCKWCSDQTSISLILILAQKKYRVSLFLHC